MYKLKGTPPCEFHKYSVQSKLEVDQASSLKILNNKHKPSLEKCRQAKLKLFKPKLLSNQHFLLKIYLKPTRTVVLVSQK